MTKSNETGAQTGAQVEAGTAEGPSDQRSPHSIRFSDAEWQLVEAAAIDSDISPATFTRNAALRAARHRKATAPGDLPPGVMELIKRTYLSTYILSTLKRDEMIGDGRGEELDRTIKSARETQAFILGDPE